MNTCVIDGPFGDWRWIVNPILFVAFARDHTFWLFTHSNFFVSNWKKRWYDQGLFRRRLFISSNRSITINNHTKRQILLMTEGIFRSLFKGNDVSQISEDQRGWWPYSNVIFCVGWINRKSYSLWIGMNQWELDWILCSNCTQRLE